ncbi:hypothetical protein GS426_02680 [Rhodococcus hoagii]|nr:hypothetical protein [Prescottella equi]
MSQTSSSTPSTSTRACSTRGKLPRALAVLLTKDGWSATYAGFRVTTTSNLRQQLRDVQWRDLEVLIEHLPDEWSYEAENLAMFLDRFDYFLRSEYASWITDPDDPEVKAERALRKRQGIKTAPAATHPARRVAAAVDRGLPPSSVRSRGRTPRRTREAGARQEAWQP